jgi:hypothetical protein
MPPSRRRCGTQLGGRSRLPASPLVAAAVPPAPERAAVRRGRAHAVVVRLGEDVPRQGRSWR